MRVRGLRSRFRGRREALGQLSTTVVASGAIQILLVVTGVILARTLGVEDRGWFAVYTVVVLVAVQVGPLGLQYAIAVAVARSPQAADEIVGSVRRRYVWQTLATTLVAGAAMVGFVHDAPGDVVWSLPLFLLSIPLTVAQQEGLAVLQGLSAFKPFNVLRAAPNAVFALLALVAVVLGTADFTTLALAWTASRVLVLPLTIRSARKHAMATERAGAEDSSSPATMAWLVQFGRRALLGAASPLESYRIDQGVVAIFLTPSALAYYVVATSFTNILRFLGQSVGIVALPRVAANKVRSAARMAAWRFLGVAALILVPSTAVLFVVGPALVVPFFGDGFAPAKPVVEILVVAACFYGLRRTLSDAVRGAGYPLLGSVAEVASLAFALVLFVLLIPPHGVEGAALALAGASALSFSMLCGMFAWADQFEALFARRTSAMPAEVQQLEEETEIGL